MVNIANFVERLSAAITEAGVEPEQCNFDDVSGQLVIAGDTTRVVPVAALFSRYAACSNDGAREALVAATAEVFGPNGAADVPAAYGDCGARLLPQLWPVAKILARQATLPTGHQLPHCGLHGEEPPLRGEGLDLGVVLVCEFIPASCASSMSALPPIETPVLASDLVRWGVSFVEALRGALENLRERTKAGLAAGLAEGGAAFKRWEHHPSGCGQSCAQDRFDAARAALFPKLIASRKRTDGLPEGGGHVVAFATTSCVLATTSKNALGLCFLGDTLHLQILPDKEKASQLLSSTPYRLLKMKCSATGAQHPLVQKAGEGTVWKWLPYTPGGPPLRSTGEFSVPIDQGEVDAILNAAEAGRQVPVFMHDDSKQKKEESAKLFVARKEEANALFKAGNYLKAIAAYDEALAVKPPPSDTDAAIAHANAAQALLNLAAADKADKRQGCAAEAMRRAMLASQMDPTYAKAHARVAAACDILGEPAAAAEARAKAAACADVASAAEAKAKSEKAAEAERKREVLEAKRAAEERTRVEAQKLNAMLEKERAIEREREEAELAKDSAATTEKLNAMLGFKDASLAGLPSGLKAST